MTESHLPIEHLSFSSIREYCENRQIFFKHYIMQQWENKSTPALIEGKVFHQFIDSVYQADMKYDEKYIEGLFEAELQATTVDWGKTGSEAKSLKTILSACGYWYDFKPQFNVTKTEQSFTAPVRDSNGIYLPIPLKGVIDAVIENSEDIWLCDWKLVTSFIDEEDIPVQYYLQAISYSLIIKEVMGKYPSKIIFHQTKKSENKDKSTSRIKEYVIENISEEWIDGFCQLIMGIYYELSGKQFINQNTHTPIFLPNPFHMIWGKESWQYFLEEFNLLTK